MPWNGSGIFEPLGSPEFPATPGEIIYAEYFNAIINDLIDGLNNALTRDGQEAPKWVDVPQIVPPAGAYTLPITARGHHIYKDDAATITVPPNASVAFAIGTIVSIYNFNASSMTLAEGAAVDLYIPTSGTPGNRTLAGYAFATMLKVGTNAWLVSGPGVT